MTDKPSTIAEQRNALSEGRSNQKRRTRQALLEAALALGESARQPALQEIAEKALVSRATAYRYFPSVEALVHEAYLERAVRSLETAVVPGEDPVEAIGWAAAAVNRLLLEDEFGVHVIERSFMQTWLDNPADARPPRAGRRLKFIEPVLTKLSAQLGREGCVRLRTALAMVMGIEAVLSMRDIAGASIEQTIAAGSWAAQALVKQALADATGRRSRKSSARRARSRRDPRKRVSTDGP